jgi:hypothetical protein
MVAYKAAQVGSCCYLQSAFIHLSERNTTSVLFYLSPASLKMN